MCFSFFFKSCGGGADEEEEEEGLSFEVSERRKWISSLCLNYERHPPAFKYYDLTVTNDDLT